MSDEHGVAPPTCVWCHVPLEPQGADAMPYWVCPVCDEVSISV